MLPSNQYKTAKIQIERQIGIKRGNKIGKLIGRQTRYNWKLTGKGLAEGYSGRSMTGRQEGWTGDRWVGRWAGWQMGTMADGWARG